MTPKRIGFLGFDGLTASHLTGAADAFAAAALDDGFGNRIPCYDVVILGVFSDTFQAESGMIFRAQGALQNAPPLDTIIIPGGSGLRRPEVSEQIAEWILTRVDQTRRIASISTGIYGLAPTGLLDGREVTTHWRFARDVAQRFPKLRVNYKRPLIKDGPFYTATGLTAGVDLSMALIEQDYGRHVALSVGRELVTFLEKRATDGDHLAGSSPESQPIDRFGDLVAWIMQNLHEDLSVEVLARRACICPRHFSRAFKSVFGSSPSDFVENLRLNEARRRLSTRRKTLRSVAESVGFSNAGAFQRAFERRFGARASSYLDRSETLRRPVGSGG